MSRARDLATFVSNADGDIKFDTDTLFIDSSENRVGIGTTSPSELLHVSSSGHSRIKVESTGTNASIEIQADSGGDNKGHFRISGDPTTAGGLFIYDEIATAERMRIDSDGNVGIGVTPSAHATNWVGLELNDAGSGIVVNSSNNTIVSNNSYYNGTNWVYGGTGYATNYRSESGTHKWNYAASGSGGGTITWSEAMRIDSSGQVGINTINTANITGVPYTWLTIVGDADLPSTAANTATNSAIQIQNVENDVVMEMGVEPDNPNRAAWVQVTNKQNHSTNYTYAIQPNGGITLFEQTQNAMNATDTSRTGVKISGGSITVNRNNGTALFLNRQSTDGDIIRFYGQGTQEGSISVSGSTVSYNGGHLSRWSQLTDGSKDETLLKGTVMTNLDQMAVWSHNAVAETYYEEGDDLPVLEYATYYEEGDTIPEGSEIGDVKTPRVYAQVGDVKEEAKDAYTEDNEQLNCMAVSSVEGDANVAGVFVSWDNDDEDFNDMMIAMTGDMVIRIAQGTTVARGDLLMSAGDGTAKPQSDDIVRSKTIAKVTSTNVSHTYDDGSYLVPCVLMAC